MAAYSYEKIECTFQGMRDYAKYVKRGRTYIDYYLEVRTADGRLVTTYTDKTLLKYRPEGESR